MHGQCNVASPYYERYLVHDKNVIDTELPKIANLASHTTVKPKNMLDPQTSLHSP